MPVAATITQEISLVIINRAMTRSIHDPKKKVMSPHIIFQNSYKNDIQTALLKR